MLFLNLHYVNSACPIFPVMVSMYSRLETPRVSFKEQLKQKGCAVAAAQGVPAVPSHSGTSLLGSPAVQSEDCQELIMLILDGQSAFIFYVL